MRNQVRGDTAYFTVFETIQKNRKKVYHGLPLTLALISIFNMDPIIDIRSLTITRIYHLLMNSHWSALHTHRLYFSRKKFKNLCGKHFKKHFLQTPLPSGRRKARNSALACPETWHCLFQCDGSSLGGWRLQPTPSSTIHPS